MSEIENKPSSSTLHLRTYQDPVDRETVLAQAKVRPQSLEAVQPTAQFEQAVAALSTGAVLAQPLPPQGELNTKTLSGASSFASNLNYVGKPTDDSNVLLSRFLKLQVLTETQDKWSQVLARHAKSLLMLGALEMSKSSVLDEANASFARAEQYVAQAESLAESYLVVDGGGQPSVSYSEGGFTFHANANPHLLAAIENYSLAEQLAGSGQPGDAEAFAAAEAALAAYIASPSRTNDLASVYGDLYQIGRMDKATLGGIIEALAAASYHNKRGNDLMAAHAQGNGASQMRKGQQLVDSMKRLDGHDEHLATVMRLMWGTESNTEKLGSLRFVEEQRQAVAGLVEAGAGYADAFQKNKSRPLNI